MNPPINTSKSRRSIPAWLLITVVLLIIVGIYGLATDIVNPIDGIKHAWAWCWTKTPKAEDPAVKAAKVAAAKKEIGDDKLTLIHEDEREKFEKKVATFFQVENFDAAVKRYENATKENVRLADENKQLALKTATWKNPETVKEFEKQRDEAVKASETLQQQLAELKQKNAELTNDLDTAQRLTKGNPPAAAPAEVPKIDPETGEETAAAEKIAQASQPPASTLPPRANAVAQVPPPSGTEASQQPPIRPPGRKQVTSGATGQGTPIPTLSQRRQQGQSGSPQSQPPRLGAPSGPRPTVVQGGMAATQEIENVVAAAKGGPGSVQVDPNNGVARVKGSQAIVRLDELFKLYPDARLYGVPAKDDALRSRYSGPPQ